MGADARKNGLAFLLIAPLLLLVLGSFLLPLGMTLYRAIEDTDLSTTLPKTAGILRAWDGKDLPPEKVFPVVIMELQGARQEQRLGPLLNRLNFEKTGLRTMLLQGSRFEGEAAPQALALLDPRWVSPGFWLLLKRATGPVTSLYVLRSMDHSRDAQGAISAVSPDEAVFIRLFIRTLTISLVVSFICLLLAYPLAYALTVVPTGWANLGLTLVLIPFWTSILVRTTAWFILLQKEGPANAFLLSAGLIEQPLTMIFTRFAVYVSMVHVLLPFAILPLYSVMKGIKPEYLKAAASLGAPGWRQFWRVYWPLSLPGVAAGGLMVFLLAMGYYITPSLVGGAGDQMVGSFIAFFTNVSVNWGMAAALASLLIGMTAIIVLVLRLIVPGLASGTVKL